MSKLAHSSDHMDEIERRNRDATDTEPGDIAGPIESGDLMLVRQILHVRGITFEMADKLAHRIVLAGFHRAASRVPSESPPAQHIKQTD